MFEYRGRLNGRIVNRKLAARNKTDAAFEVEQLRSAARRSDRVTVDRTLTIARLAEKFRQAAEADPEISPRTRDDWLTRIDHHVLPTLGRVRVCDLDAYAVRRFARGLPSMRAKTHRNVLSVLSVLLAWAVAEGLASENPVSRARERFPRDLRRTDTTRSSPERSPTPRSRRRSPKSARPTGRSSRSPPRPAPACPRRSACASATSTSRRGRGRSRGSSRTTARFARRKRPAAWPPFRSPTPAVAVVRERRSGAHGRGLRQRRRRQRSCSRAGAASPFGMRNTLRALAGSDQGRTRRAAAAARPPHHVRLPAGSEQRGRARPRRRSCATPGRAPRWTCTRGYRATPQRRWPGCGRCSPVRVERSLLGGGKSRMLSSLASSQVSAVPIAMVTSSFLVSQFQRPSEVSEISVCQPASAAALGVAHNVLSRHLLHVHLAGFSSRRREGGDALYRDVTAAGRNLLPSINPLGRSERSLVGRELQFLRRDRETGPRRMRLLVGQPRHQPPDGPSRCRRRSPRRRHYGTHRSSGGPGMSQRLSAAVAVATVLPRCPSAEPTSSPEIGSPPPERAHVRVADRNATRRVRVRRVAVRSGFATRGYSPRESRLVADCCHNVATKAAAVRPPVARAGRLIARRDVPGLAPTACRSRIVRSWNAYVDAMRF